jgi:hypothetical protein
MEWNGQMYFGWPLPAWCGKVYRVDPKAVRVGSIVSLPDGIELQLTLEDDYLVVTGTSSRNRSQAATFQAEFVFDTDDSTRIFEDNWNILLDLINAAAAVNSLFTVYLTPEEYQRLAANNESEFERLKENMSRRAASLVVLHEADFGDQEGGGRPSVSLYRTGRCP